MISRLLSPKALLSHALVLAVAVTCVWLGQWQLDRLAQVRGANALAADRMTQAAAPLDELLTAADGPDGVASIQYRRVEATGTFRPEDEVLQRNQSYQGRSGFHVLTPMELQDGRVLLVRRGWVPAEHDDPPVAEAAPPEGEVTLSGVVELPVSQPSFGARDPEEGVLERVFHADTERLAAQVDGELLPVVLRVVDLPDPAAFDVLPVPPGPPAFDEGNHLSYAVQWHIFGVLALVTYGAFLWSRRRHGGDGSGGGRDDAPPDDDPAPRSTVGVEG
jgi:surfeit locus 1 family protein